MVLEMTVMNYADYVAKEVQVQKCIAQLVKIQLIILVYKKKMEIVWLQG